MIIAKNLFLAFIIFIVIINIVKSVEPLPIDNQNLVDIRELVGVTDKEITARGIILEDSKYGNKKLTFTYDDAEINIGNDKFTNVQSQNKARLPSFIELDKQGNVYSAEFTANEKGGNYCFGNNCVNAPPNSRIFFSKVAGIMITLTEDSNLLEMPKPKDSSFPIDYETTLLTNKKNIILPSGAILNGNLHFDKTGQSFVDASKFVDGNYQRINGVGIGQAILSDKLNEVNVYFDGKEHLDSSRNYISFGSNNMIIGQINDYSGSQSTKFLTDFGDENPYIPSTPYTTNTGTYSSNVKIIARAPSRIYINNENGNPSIKTIGESYIYNGVLTFSQDSSRVVIIKQDYNVKISSTPMRIDFNDRNGGSLFGGNQIIVDRSNGFKLGRRINYR